MISFQKKVYQVARKIPKGKTLTYKEIAKKAGLPKAWRVVGNILNENRNSSIPCYRVVKSNREVGGYSKGTERKIYLLKKEGIKINKYGKITS